MANTQPTKTARKSLHNVARFTVSGYAYDRASVDQRVIGGLLTDGYIAERNGSVYATRKGLSAAGYTNEAVIARAAAYTASRVAAPVAAGYAA
jgi:hypothetical protein